MPQGLEGPLLVPISPGHGLSVLDTVALLPMTIGACWALVGLWQRRQPLMQKALASPVAYGATTFIAGLGVGLLMASDFSDFFWWWLIGAALVGSIALGLVLLSSFDEKGGAGG